MRILPIACVVFGTGFFLVSSLRAQFVSATSSTDFHVVADSTNSRHNSGTAISGEFLWDANNSAVRVIINHIEGPSMPSGDNWLLDTFGIKLPQGAVVTGGDYDEVGNPHDPRLLRYIPISNFSLDPYGDDAPVYFPMMDVGYTRDPVRGSAVGPNQPSYFDWTFGSSIPPEDFSLSGFGYDQAEAGAFNILFRVQYGHDLEAPNDVFGGYIPEPSFYGLACLVLVGLATIIKRMVRSK